MRLQCTVHRLWHESYTPSGSGSEEGYQEASSSHEERLLIDSLVLAPFCFHGSPAAERDFPLLFHLAPSRCMTPKLSTTERTAEQVSLESIRGQTPRDQSIITVSCGKHNAEAVLFVRD